MKICVLVKEVPDAAVTKRINPNSGRLDRSGRLGEDRDDPLADRLDDRPAEAAGAVVEDAEVPVREGTALFVEAGAEHRFSAYENLSLLVIFERKPAEKP